MCLMYIYGFTSPYIHWGEEARVYRKRNGLMSKEVSQVSFGEINKQEKAVPATCGCTAAVQRSACSAYRVTVKLELGEE